MNLRQLAYWVAVVDTASFTRAAELTARLPARVLAADPGTRGGARRRADRAAAARHPAHACGEGVPAGGACGRARRGARAVPRAAPSRCRRRARDRDAALDRGRCAPDHDLAPLPPPPGVSVGLREFAHRLELEQNVRSGVADMAVGPRPVQTTGRGRTPRLGGVRRGCRPTGSARRSRRRAPGAARGPRRTGAGSSSPAARPLRPHRGRVRAGGLHPPGHGESPSRSRPPLGWRRLASESPSSPRHRARRARARSAGWHVRSSASSPPTRGPSGRLPHARCSECCARDAGAGGRATRK